MKAQSISSLQTDSFRIQEAGLRDILELYRLEKKCFPLDSWPLIDLFFALVFPGIVRLKAVSGGRMIGFGLGERSRRPAWIATLGVDPEFRRQGVGRRLLDALEMSLDRAAVRLCVRVSNTGARALYEGAGYREINRWKGYYRGGEDAVVMEKQLRPIRPGSGFGV